MVAITRRNTLSMIAMVCLIASASSFALASTKSFSVSNYEKLLSSGKPFLVGVHTNWCTTCAAQKRVIGSLRKQGEPYSDLAILEMDWDKFRGSEIGKQLQIPRRSTLVMFANGAEVGRIIAGTSAESIKSLIDKGVK